MSAESSVNAMDTTGLEPVHHRSIEFSSFEREGAIIVVGRLRDERPWATGEHGPRYLHDMELRVLVDMVTMTIIDARANMATFPHFECPSIEPAFSDLIGLSIARGYTRAVTERFGAQRGCTHLEFLARAVGPVVVQSVTSAAARRAEVTDNEDVFTDRGWEWLKNTCHMWAEDGIGVAKIQLGWRPGKAEYPAPSLEQIRERIPADSD